MIDRRMLYFIYKPPHQFTWKTLPQTDAIVCKLVLQTVCLNISWAVVIFHLCKRTTKTNPLFAGRYIVRETSMLVEKYYKIEFISNDFKNCYAKIIYVGIEPKFSYWHQTVSAMRHGGLSLAVCPCICPFVYTSLCIRQSTSWTLLGHHTKHGKYNGEKLPLSSTCVNVYGSE